MVGGLLQVGTFYSGGLGVIVSKGGLRLVGI